MLHFFACFERRVVWLYATCQHFVCVMFPCTSEAVFKLLSCRKAFAVHSTSRPVSALQLLPYGVNYKWRIIQKVTLKRKTFIHSFSCIRFSRCANSNHVLRICANYRKVYFVMRCTNLPSRKWLTVTGFLVEIGEYQRLDAFRSFY